MLDLVLTGTDQFQLAKWKAMTKIDWRTVIQKIVYILDGKVKLKCAAFMNGHWAMFSTI